MFLLTIISCNHQDTTQEIRGYIYIKLIDLGNLQGLSKERIDSIKKEMENDNKVTTQEEKDIYNYFDLIFKNELENKSTFFLELDGNNDRVRVFISPEEYQPIDNLIKDLDKENERIELVLQAKPIEDGVFLAEKIKSIQKTSGKTNWSK